MKVELEVGIALMACLAIGIGSCEKVSDTVNDENAISDYTLVADSIRNDSTVENRELMAVVCESLFDQEYLGDKSSVKITKKLMMDKISVVPFNGNSLVQINYEFLGSNKQCSVGLFLLDSNLTTLSTGIVVGSLSGNPEISVFDWNKDKIQDLKVNFDMPVGSPDVVESVESIHSFNAASGFKEVFSLVLEHRNCSSVRTERWNYTARSYSVISSSKISVTEANYQIDCEEFDRMGKISKLRKISSNTYEVEL